MEREQGDAAERAESGTSDYVSECNSLPWTEPFSARTKASIAVIGAALLGSLCLVLYGFVRLLRG